MKRKGIQSYKKKLDKIFSVFIRMREADKNGMTKCYTCGVPKHWKELQCGHFCPRQYLSLRYDETNCHVQCYACNMLYNGQPSVFALNLERDYGVGTVQLLENRRKEITKYFPYEVKLVEYSDKVKQLEKLTYPF